MAEEVKRATAVGGGRAGRTRVSSKHQVTIPREAFQTAGLRAGDTLRVESAGPGRVTLTRLDALLDAYRGALTGGAITNGDLERMRDEWR
jgi:bifunctional DNA-binding transcriptional regulator/antitoxin component of YhaV-PrlF toxin-antitoxin module